MGTPLPAAPPATAPDRPKDAPTIWEVDDALWAELEPILRIDKPRKKPGRPRRDNRAIFDGLIWLARTGSQWSELPTRFAPKSTAHLRFTEWVATGALERTWAVLLRTYDAELGLDWEWQAADGCIVKAPFGKKGDPARRRPRAATPPTGANPGPSATS
jgi:transposase